jgi:hypothetical protein
LSRICLVRFKLPVEMSKPFLSRQIIKTLPGLASTDRAIADSAFAMMLTAAGKASSFEVARAASASVMVNAGLVR